MGVERWSPSRNRPWFRTMPRTAKPRSIGRSRRDGRARRPNRATAIAIRTTAPTPMRQVATAKGEKPVAASMASAPKTGKSPKQSWTAARARSPALTEGSAVADSGAISAPLELTLLPMGRRE